MSTAELVQHHSLRIEAALKHAFVAELYSYAWSVDPSLSIRIYEADSDDMGFDLVVSLGRLTRHIQLKSTFQGSTTRSVKLRKSLTTLIGGCAVWCVYDPKTLKIGHYRFLGYSSDQEDLDFSLFPLAKNSRGNAKGIKKIRSDTHVIPKDAFRNNFTIRELSYVMLGIPRK